MNIVGWFLVVYLVVIFYVMDIAIFDKPLTFEHVW